VNGQGELFAGGAAPAPEFPREMLALPALSIRQPWAWAILHAGKDVENRTWAAGFRGRFLIHAGKGMTGAEFAEGMGMVRAVLSLRGVVDAALPGVSGLARGGIVGVASLVDCVARSDSPWFVGPWGFVLRDVQPLPFWPCRGALGFFRVQPAGGAG
jgi:hypothetical protein